MYHCHYLHLCDADAVCFGQGIKFNQSKHRLSHPSIAVARCRLVVPLPAWEWFGPSWLTLGPSHLPLCISTPPRWASWEINMMMKKITHFTNIKQKVSFTSLLLPVCRINEADITHQDGSFSGNVGPAVIWSFPNIPVMLQRKQKSNPSGFWLDTDTRTMLAKIHSLPLVDVNPNEIIICQKLIYKWGGNESLVKLSLGKTNGTSLLYLVPQGSPSFCVWRLGSLFLVFPCPSLQESQPVKGQQKKQKHK